MRFFVVLAILCVFVAGNALAYGTGGGLLIPKGFRKAKTDREELILKKEIEGLTMHDTKRHMWLDKIQFVYGDRLKHFAMFIEENRQPKRLDRKHRRLLGIHIKHNMIESEISNVSIKFRLRVKDVEGVPYIYVYHYDDQGQLKEKSQARILYETLTGWRYFEARLSSLSELEIIAEGYPPVKLLKHPETTTTTTTTTTTSTTTTVRDRTPETTTTTTTSTTTTTLRVLPPVEETKSNTTYYVLGVLLVALVLVTLAYIIYKDRRGKRGSENETQA